METSRPLYVLFFLTLLTASAFAQQSSLSVAEIMQDPATYIGDWPSMPVWSEDGQSLYFEWNPFGEFPSDSLFKITRDDLTPRQVSRQERLHRGPTFTGWHHGEHIYDTDVARKVYVERGDVFLYELKTGTSTRLTQTRDIEESPRFSLTGDALIFERNHNLYKLFLDSGALVELTDLRDGSAPDDPSLDTQDRFLEDQQSELFEIIRQELEEEELEMESREKDDDFLDLPPTWYLHSKSVFQLQIDPTERFVTFVTSSSFESTKRTRSLDWVTDSGYTEVLTSRGKVGAILRDRHLYIQDLIRDTTYQVDLHQIEGAYDVPEYMRDHVMEVDSSESKRNLFSYGPFWSRDGQYAVLEVRSDDNKDRWLMRLDPVTATLDLLDRQHDEAWIAGPGISWFGGRSAGGWLPDGQHYYYQSESTGYSHLYTVNVATGEIHQLTDGAFEIFNPVLSKSGDTWYFSSSEGSSSVRHYYHMDLHGEERTRLTTLSGRNTTTISPDGDMLAVLNSIQTRPPEIYIQEPHKQATRITHSQTSQWLEYSWRTPETRKIMASDGMMVPAHVFEPTNPNGAAVLFVHGAGYMQNVHDGWSSYFREYMFHNLLADLGYVVIQLDFRASAGYGRDWRTAIYRHMGGRDLQDYVDASQYITETYGIDPDHIGIYGGSYGGFITLMALFTEPEYFGAGAALRSVTDWAHYNHGYTSNILNTPATDSLAFARSSPINFAEGLEDPLLMPHGMVDLNVQFQDIVRLGQRLIELGKEDWEIALYPVEGHGFQEPSSWTDQYRRILNLFETHIRP